jgi:hypothetical protein
VGFIRFTPAKTRQKAGFLLFECKLKDTRFWSLLIILNLNEHNKAVSGNFPLIQG